MSQLFAILLCLFPVSAAADIGPRWSDQDLVSFSDAIVVGRVADIGVARDTAAGGIYTYVTIEVTEVVKGWISDRRIVIKQLGGSIDGVGLLVPGQPRFSRGEETLLFLEARPRDASLYTSALWQGKWSIERDASGQVVARRVDPELVHRRFGASAEHRLLASFLPLLRALSGNASRRPTGTLLNTRPLETPAPSERSRGSAQFSLLGPARWHEADTNEIVRIDVQDGGQPGLAGGGMSEVQTAISLWNGAGSSLRLSMGSPRTARCFGEFEGDAHISITFMDPCGEISDSGGTLAIGGGWFSEADSRVVNGQPFLRFVQGNVINNNSTSALMLLQRSRCFQDIQTHEIGHAIGLNHSDRLDAIMYPNIDGTCMSAGIEGRTIAGITGGLGQDDVAGARFVYPLAVGMSPGAPLNLTGSAIGSTVNMVWNPPSVGGQVVTYIIEAGSAPGATDLANFPTGNTATSFEATGVPSGRYFVRVRAQNSAGVGTSSNEILITVGPGPCTLPGLPVGLNFSLAGSTVTLRWTPPLSGGSVASYLVEAGSVPGAANLANIDTGTAVPGLVATAPPGTYFVRTRARNACGTGPASNEVTIVVP